MPADQPILIIGGNGKTGRRVDERLKTKGFATRPVSRSTTPSFDWNDQSGWAVALDGVKIAYVTYQPDIAIQGAKETIAALCKLAKAKGLEHIVLLSGRGEREAQEAERILTLSGVEWTVVRASWFNQNFSESYFVEGILAGELALPARDMKEPFVDADDIADVVVAALTGSVARNRVYEVTGPRAITYAEAVAEIATATSRPIAYRRISQDEFTDGLRQADVPDDIIALLVELFDQVLDGRNVTTTNGVEEALGRKPKDFSEYVRENAAAGIWGN
jgi:uncharacterized protein YbjT (DUF2867 family)